MDEELWWFDAPVHAVQQFRYPPFDSAAEIMANIKYHSLASFVDCSICLFNITNIEHSNSQIYLLICSCSIADFLANLWQCSWNYGKYQIPQPGLICWLGKHSNSRMAIIIAYFFTFNCCLFMRILANIYHISN